MFFGGIIGMAFEAELVMRMNNRSFDDRFQECNQVPGRKKCWRTSTQMNFTNNRRFAHELPIQFPFGNNSTDVFLLYVMIRCNLLVAPTVSAKSFAEG